MSVYDERREELEQQQFMMGAERGRLSVTLDLLSSGRLTLGVGLGSARNGEFGPFGEVDDPRERAKLLDAGLEQVRDRDGGDDQDDRDDDQQLD